MKKTVSLAMGNGGVENMELIQKTIQRHLQNEYLAKAEDATPLPPLENPVFTTDSFTISPIFFPGGDIGKLAIAGACNDLAMMGAKPKFLSLSFIIEEGFLLRDLEKIVRSMKKELSINGAWIVTGDTKVVPKGSCDGVYINVSAIGERVIHSSQENITIGDKLLVSGDIARHGAAIFAGREGIELANHIESDCKSLWPIVEELIEAGIKIKAMRDATRGGVAAVLNEWAMATNTTMEIEEGRFSIDEGVQGICEILGFEPFVLANEGTFMIVVDQNDAKRAQEILQKHNPYAAIVGEVSDSYPGRVTLQSEWGTKRFLDMPTGEILPRIC
ncbi:hydrogenase expression/formation protein HypE [Nitratiruptor sp. YY08-26]|uniref:hydrogenase expression/formation protein HypE n=1 Tax=unclassified Nitratiruptor TaxID=2624044 RepID=UPI0019154792|nr:MULTISPECIES: hydrogenase expression/formation protein HypE [unclassified Nitratiruptor]BCD62374.1 hydrogenase expression/formation protein HypE [Nitratiruptor sp. YY08-13]BCD66310.1 hydrogenase expression/formation protein HypE [Nitratiruptor sp. YY08-26]